MVCGVAAECVAVSHLQAAQSDDGHVQAAEVCPNTQQFWARMRHHRRQVPERWGTVSTKLRCHEKRVATTISQLIHVPNRAERRVMEGCPHPSLSHLSDVTEA